MLSAFIPSRRSYPAVLLAEQLVHQRSVHPGPHVLRTAPLKVPTPATDRDRTVSRRSEPSSRAAFMREQPNPWARGLTRLLYGKSYLEGGFTLRCFQRLSLPDVATQLCSWRNNWYTRGQSIPVLTY